MRNVVFVAPSGAVGFFKRVVRALGDEVEPTYHDMLLSLPQPAADWSLALEAQALREMLADREDFDLVAFSGGATVVLAWLGESDRPQRIRSLTLAEPPWVGRDLWSETERAFVAEFDRLITLPPEALWSAFGELYAPGEGLPPSPNVERVASDLRTCWTGYRASDLDRDALRAITAPVYLPVAERSPQRMNEAAELLAGVFPHSRVEVFAKRGHFDLFYLDAPGVAAGIRRCWS